MAGIYSYATWTLIRSCITLRLKISMKTSLETSTRDSIRVDTDHCLGGKVMTEFVALRPKLYAYKKLDGEEDKRCKELRSVW